jgi:hypothetical protein
MKHNIISLFIILLFFSTCKKENPEPKNVSGTSTFSYARIYSSNGSIKLGETVEITAEASGDNLSYNWQASAGTLVGEGNTVTYGSTCTSCKGKNTITCTVSNGVSSETKSVVVEIR